MSQDFDIFNDNIARFVNTSINKIFVFATLRIILKMFFTIKVYVLNKKLIYQKHI